MRRHALDGVGLFRTQFLFLDSREAPSFERQVNAYRRVIEALGELPLAIRTLDLGGDTWVAVRALESQGARPCSSIPNRVCLEREG